MSAGVEPLGEAGHVGRGRRDAFNCKQFEQCVHAQAAVEVVVEHDLGQVAGQGSEVIHPSIVVQ